MRITLLIISIFLFIGCARQNSPTGGDKDIDPPIVLSAEPPFLSTRFSESQFTLEFDEYIEVKNLTEQLVISPPLKSPPDYTLRGKKLVLSWEESLKPNTTYQFNFGNAVADITEGNTAANMLYVFSTGAYIDSLSIEGKVLYAKDNQPAPDVAVMLYVNDSDSLPYTTRPDFFGFTDESGMFRINFLPQGDFKIFALKEESGNYLYDGPPEEIGFLPQRISSQVDDSLFTVLTLPLFVEKDTVQYLVSSENRDYGFHQVIFNLPAKNPEVSFWDVEREMELKAISFLSERRDTLTSWITFEDDEPIPEEIRIITKDLSEFADTTFWYPETDPEYRAPPKLTITSNLDRNKLNPKDDIRINFSNPIEKIDSTLIILLKDSVPSKPLALRKSISGLNLLLEIEKDRQATYSLVLDEGAVRDVFGVYSDSSYFSFRLEDEEYYGSLTITINDSLIDNKPNPMYELLDEKGKIMRSAKLNLTEGLKFSRMEPGKYGFQITFDRNENGKWDTGNYTKEIQPEERIIYQEPLEIRSNWDLEVDWLPRPEKFDTNPQ